MNERNNGAKRRRAFSDFKESQYDESFSLNPLQKKKENAKKYAEMALIIVLTAVFIIIGFGVTDALLNASEEPYEDENTYTAAYVESTASSTTSAVSETETTEKTEQAQQWENQNYNNGNDSYYNNYNQVMGNY